MQRINKIFSFIGVLSVLVPLIGIGVYLFQEPGEFWQHMWLNLFPRASLNSFLLIILTNLFALFFGFFGALGLLFLSPKKQKIYSILMTLPLAFPLYIYAYVFLGGLETYSLLGSLLHKIFVDWSFMLRTLPMAAFVLSLGLYPYYFLILKLSFQGQNIRYLELASALGAGPWRLLKHVLLPLSKPALLAAMVLVSFEVFSDFSVSYLFNINTLSTLIYKSWYGFYSLASAARFSLVLLVFSLFLYFVFKKQLKEARFYGVISTGFRLQTSFKISLLIEAALLVFLIPALFYPLSELLFWAFEKESLQSMWIESWNSLWISALSSLLIVFSSVFLLWKTRKKSSWSLSLIKNTSQLGYVLPGGVLALGVFTGVYAIVHGLSSFLIFLPIFFIGLVILILALSLRFFAVGQSNVLSAFSRVTPELDSLCSLMGVSGWQKFIRLYLPLSFSSLVVAWLVVFIEALKELPVTLMARPLGISTLSTHIFQWLTEGQWAQAAQPTLVLLLLGLVVLIVSEIFSKKNLVNE